MSTSPAEHALFERMIAARDQTNATASVAGTGPGDSAISSATAAAWMVAAMRTASWTWSSVRCPSTTTFSCARTQASQPLIARRRQREELEVDLARRRACRGGSCAGAPASPSTRACRRRGGTGSRRCSSPSAPPPRGRPRSRARRRRAGRRRGRPRAAPAWRAAAAEATATPQRCAGERLPSASTVCRFSLTSRARLREGLPDRLDAVVDQAVSDLQRGLALLPVAGAELVGLQGVEDAQDLVDVAADREVVDADVADDRPPGRR